METKYNNMHENCGINFSGIVYILSSNVKWWLLYDHDLDPGFDLFNQVNQVTCKF